MFKSLGLKKWTSLLAAVMLTTSLITPTGTSAAETKISQPKVLSEGISKSAVAAAGADSTVLQILSTTDTHGRFVPYDYAVNASDTKGSLAQIATAVKQFRGQNPENTVLVDAGDTIQDNSASLFLNDEQNPMMLAMNAIGYDAWTLGNHEFNYGIPTLKKVMSQFKPVDGNSNSILCGNVYNSDGTRLGAPYKIVTTKAGVKVGIIGMVTPNITKWDASNLQGYNVTNPVEETKKAIAEIKDKVDIMIAVNHMGETGEYDAPGSGAIEVAAACPELAAIVCAHFHVKIAGDYYYNGKIYSGKDITPEVKSKGTLMVEANKWAQNISQINIKLTKKDGKYIIADKGNDISSAIYDMSTKAGVAYQPDADLSSTLQPYNQRAIDDANTVVGKLEGGDLVPQNEVSAIPQSQVQPTAMIDLINKVEMYYGKAEVASSAAFISDANIKAGPIKKSDTALIYKYDNTLKVLQVTGKQLKQYMEWSAAYYNTYKPGDLTVSFNAKTPGYNYDMFSGVKYQIDVSKPTGNRIVNLTKMDGTPIQDTDTIKLAVNNYRADTTLLNDQNGLFKGQGVKVLYDSQKELGDAGRIRDLIRNYIVDVKGGTIAPECDNNWSIVGNNWDASQRAQAVKLINDGKIKIPGVAGEQTSVNTAAVTYTDVLKASASKVVDVVSFNDFHGNLAEDTSDKGKNVGVAKLVAAIKAAKAANPNTIVVSGGDNYQGSAMSNLTHGAPVSEMMKSVGVIASSVGNHEFDWGVDWISKWAKDGNFDYLASNIYDKATGKPVEWAKPYKIVEQGGVKIGFVGITTPTTAYTTKADNVKNLEFRSPDAAASEWADYLKSGKAPEGKADVVIALTHMGSFQDQNGAITGEVVDAKLCDVKNVDAVISAHSHQTVCGLVNGKPVVQAYYAGRALAKLSIMLDDSGKVVGIAPSVDSLSAKKSQLVADNDGKAIYNKYDAQLKPITEQVVGYTDKELTHDKNTTSSVLGAWVSNFMKQSAGTQIAVTNGGGLRCPIPAGNITMGKLYEMMPFDNIIVKLDLKGSDLKRVLENGIGNTSVGDVQYAGVILDIDSSKPFGSRIKSMKLSDGTPIDMDKYYSVATNDFMYNPDAPAKGGDGYDFTGAKNVVNTGIDIRQSIVDGLKGTSAVAKLPKTGSVMDFEAMMSLGTIATLMGIALFFIEKRKKKERNAA